MSFCVFLSPEDWHWHWQRRVELFFPVTDFPNTAEKYDSREVVTRRKKEAGFDNMIGSKRNGSGNGNESGIIEPFEKSPSKGTRPDERVKAKQIWSSEVELMTCLHKVKH